MRFNVALEDFGSIDTPPICLSIEARSPSEAMAEALAEFRVKYPSLNLAHYALHRQDRYGEAGE